MTEERKEKSEDLWNPYKDLVEIIRGHLQEDRKHISELEGVLKKYKQNFFSLLQNLPKNAKSREELKKGMDEGIQVRGIGYQTLSKELYQETIIISDMFDLNEFVALDLLCTAQIQMSYYPGLPRGLVAVLLYYDGRKCIASALRMLIQARKGVSWSLKITEEMENYITDYTDQLAENGLFERIFELLRSMDLTKELEKLQQNLALGGPKHRKLVIDLFNTTKLILADCVFLWSVHCGLKKNVTLGLIHHLKGVEVERDASGTIDDVSLFLLMALLCALDLSILHTREDGEELIQQLPLLTEQDFIEAVHNELSKCRENWACTGLLAVVLFGFGVCLSTLRLLTQFHQLHILEKDERYVDDALELHAFEFLTHVVLGKSTFYSEEFMHKRMHNLFCDFVTQMYSKVKEMRLKADETARTISAYANEGLEPPPTLSHHFEQLLVVIAKLYSEDPLELNLMLEYWSSVDNNTSQAVSYRIQSRGTALLKFVRLAGDMIPSLLFVPYLNMLASLSRCSYAAKCCFNMLKQSGPGFTMTTTWDHFFMSFNQYYSNLRQEVVPTSDLYRQRSTFHKGITPQEINGLQAVVKLMRSIAEHDEFSRLALCEHPGWAPLTILLGLVSCGIPIPLKAELLLTLGTLSRSPETASHMWNNLEGSQILVTIPTASNYQPRGMQTELEEVESRIEEYPLTKAFLKLLDSLTEYGVPRTLGAGTRLPGFDPYLNFIVNYVFLKANSRPYKDPVERWEVTGLCLHLFLKFLMQYHPDISDFPMNKPSEFNAPPGFHIMLQMNTKSEFFNHILLIVDEGSRLFDLYTAFPGQKQVEKCTLLALNLIERVLVLQPAFSELLVSSCCPILLTSLYKLLLTINVRTGKPDHIINVAKYVNYQLAVPKQCFQAVKILTLVTKTSTNHHLVMNILLSSTEVNKEIRNGFVECLDAYAEENESIVLETKEAILKLLKQCLTYSAPNLTHFLLGFDMSQDISKTLFQLPGILDFPRTCIHSLLGILRFAIIEPQFKPSLIESAYHMLYLLCCNGKTSTPVLKLIRMQSNFFKDHLQRCMSRMNEGIHELNQLSWLLKILAIEVKVSSRTNQILYLKQLIFLLHGLKGQDTCIDPYTLIPQTNEYPDKTVVNEDKGASVLVNLISSFEFEVKDVATPRWDYVDNSTLETLMKKCQNDANPPLIDIKKLHKILQEQLSNYQGASVLGQKQAISQEVQKILLHAINLNNTRASSASIVRFVDSWRLLLEITVIYTPYEILSAQDQQHLIVYLLDNLLSKIVNSNLLLEVANYLSGATMLLLENLRRCHLRELKQLKIMEKGGLPSSTQLTSHSELLRRVLVRLLQWLLGSDVIAQKLRTNLYASLVTFLNLVSMDKPNQELHVDDSLYVSRLDSSKRSIERSQALLAAPGDIFTSFGDKLFETLCHDCSGGQEICKMLAMSTFSLITTLNFNTNFIHYTSRTGFFKNIVESILTMENELKSVLEPVPPTMRPLYLYESKMSLLIRISMSRVGAEMLLEHKLLACLSAMKVFDFHPQITKEVITDNEIVKDVVLPIENRYLQIWLPTLHLCNTIITTLGSDNQSACSQILYFLFNHMDCVDLILRSGHPTLSRLSLKELSILTSVIARTANNTLTCTLEMGSIPQDNRSQLYRIQKLMLSLIPRFLLSDQIARELNCDEDVEDTLKSPSRLLYSMKIIANLLMYSRNIVANHGIEHNGVGIIFQPSLNDALNNLNGKQFKNLNDNIPSLGVVVQQLINAVNHHHKEKNVLEYINRKLVEIPNMNTMELKDIVQMPIQHYDLSVMRENALEIMADKLGRKKLEIEYCNFMIEHGLYIIWVHLDYYMLKAIPRAKNYGFQNINMSFNVNETLASASEVMWKVSTDDVSNLKQGLVSIFNDSFSKQLIETAYDRSEADKGLLEVLLRKIKRLIKFVPVN